MTNNEKTVRELGDESVILKHLLEPIDLPKEEKEKLLENFTDMRRRFLEVELIDVLNDFFKDDLDDKSTILETPEDRILHVGNTHIIFGDGIKRHIEVDFHLDKLIWKNYIDGELVLEEPREKIEDVIYEIKGCCYDDIVRACVYEGNRRYGNTQNPFF